MGSFWHVLKRATTRRFPRNWCFVDTEAKFHTENPKVEYHTLRLGVACYVRNPHNHVAGCESWFQFSTPAEFWGPLLEQAEPDRRLVIFGYNMGYDLRLLNTFQELTDRGFKPSKIFVKMNCVLVEFKDGKRIVLLLDAMNFFRGSLESWGKMLNLPKGKVNFRKIIDKKLFTYCHQDVLILKTLWERWREFLQQNNMGHFSPTLASQALTAYRHRFMPRKIFIHAQADAIALERQSYYGGRTECFKLGKYNRGPYYKLDVNSMYPFIMSKLSVPVRFCNYHKNISLRTLAQTLESYGVVSRVKLSTEKRCYPYRLKGRLVFPIGNFWATLSGPELQLAFDNNDIVQVGSTVTYTKRIIFNRFIDTLYKLRRKFQEQNNQPFEQMVKYLLNSLYGKFAQKNQNQKYLSYNKKNRDGVYNFYDASSGLDYQHMVICGHVWLLWGEKEAYHSFTAISSYITAAARVYLWRLITQAGIDNVFYMDTDSLIVNSLGLKNLQPYLNAYRLGALKLEYKTNTLDIRGLKDYQTDNEERIKGVPKSAKKIGTSMFEYQEWEGLAGAIRRGHHDRVYLTKRVKVLSREYTKGQVSVSGSVSPLSLDCDA